MRVHVSEFCSLSLLKYMDVFLYSWLFYACRTESKKSLNIMILKNDNTKGKKKISNRYSKKKGKM